MITKTVKNGDSMSYDHKASLATIEMLAETFPQCFSVFEKRRKPLKLGVHTDILAASDIAPTVLSAALRAYCGNRCYLEASKEGAARIDLNGHVAGSVTKDEADNARQRLEQQRAKQKRDAAAQAKGQAQVQAKAQAKARNVGRLSLADLRKAAQARKLTAA